MATDICDRDLCQTYFANNQTWIIPPDQGCKDEVDGYRICTKCPDDNFACECASEFDGGCAFAMNTTVYYSTMQTKPDTTILYTSTNTMDKQPISILNTTADIDFYYIWIIMFSLFIIPATGIIIRFFLYHFGRLNSVYAPSNDTPSPKETPIGSNSTDREVEMMARIDAALSDDAEERNFKEDNGP